MQCYTFQSRGPFSFQKWYGNQNDSKVPAQVKLFAENLQRFFESF